MFLSVKGPPGPTEISPTLANGMRDFGGFWGIFGFENVEINSIKSLDQNLTRNPKKMDKIIETLFFGHPRAPFYTAPLKWPPK